MIPLSLFNILVAVEVLLVLYSIIDVRNRYYGNIVTAFIASLLGIFLAVVISVGVVQYDPSVYHITSIVWSNTSAYDPELQQTVWTNVSSYASTCTDCAVPIFDASVGYMLMIFAVVMMIYSLVMIYDAYVEHKLEKEGEE